MGGVRPAKLSPHLWLWPWGLIQAALAPSLVLHLEQYCLLGAIIPPNFMSILPEVKCLILFSGTAMIVAAAEMATLGRFCHLDLTSVSRQEIHSTSPKSHPFIVTLFGS